MSYTYILDKNNNPMMPTQNGAYIRKLLKENKAKVVQRKPFTIKLLFDIKNKHIQPVTIGVDAGYKHIGLSASNNSAELFSAEVEQECGMVERNKERKMYRTQRRHRLRYRKARFNNRVSTKKEGWIAPSLERKRDMHIKNIEKINKILPVNKINIEIGLFDPALMKATAEGRTISGVEYQQGEIKGFENIKTYIRNRDKYTCQNPNCICHKLSKEEKSKLKLYVHHLGYWKNDRTNRPANLITLCQYSHTPENHESTGFLYGWKPKLKTLKETAFMNIVRKEIVDNLKYIYPDKEIRYTYGYKTNLTRKDWNVEKTHHDDAFCIANQYTKNRCNEVIYYKQQKRNNRSLERFTDAKYMDSRDGKIKTGKELFCGRTTRNKLLAGENLHKYRKQKVSKGKRAIRNIKYKIQPADLLIVNNEKKKMINMKLISKGCNGYGKTICLGKINDKNETTGIKTVKLLKCASGQYIKDIEKRD